MIEQVPEAWKKILLNRQVVHFIDRERESDRFPERFSNKYFRVKRRQEIPYDRTWILDERSGSNPSVDIDFSDDNIALYPENPKTLYEIVIGVKSETGSAVLYPLASINETFLSLEKSGFTPVENNPSKRYIGITEGDTPEGRETLRYHTVEDMNSVGLRVFNDSAIDNKIVLSFSVNRCLLEEVKKENLTQKEKERMRDIEYFNLKARGGW